MNCNQPIFLFLKILAFLLFCMLITENNKSNQNSNDMFNFPLWSIRKTYIFLSRSIMFIFLLKPQNFKTINGFLRFATVYFFYRQQLMADKD